MRRAYCRLGIALVIAGLLSGCDGGGQKGSATPEAAGQFMELRVELEALAATDWMVDYAPEELLEVVQNFIQTADPTYHSNTNKYSILHIACMLKKAELARCLLLDGADPNAPTMMEGSPAETPLLYALTTDYAPDATAQEINSLVDVLVAAGASLATPGSAETGLAYNACLACAHEEVYAHLLDIGVPRSGNELQECAYRGWLSTLTRLLNEKGGITPADYALLPTVARMSDGYYTGEHLACARYLIESGAPADAPDEVGRTALFCLATGYSTLKENGMGDAALELAEYLLNKGANPYLRIDKEPDYPGFSAYDLIKGNSDLLQALQQKGFSFTPPAMEIRSGEYLAADVCRAALTHPDAEAIAPYFDTIATLLNPTDELREQEIYTDALRNAVILMAQTDADKTSAIIANMPLWKDPQAMKPHNHITSALLYALQDTRSIILPKELLLTVAEECQKNGAYEQAAILTELLGRAADSDALIEQLSQDDRPAIKAGALSARLYKEGLPAASDGGVADWLAEHRRSADTPLLQKALLLTSIERLWYGDMSTEEMDAFVAAIQELGLPHVAEIYRQIITHLSHPEQLDEIMATQHLWAYELEIATAQFLLQHKDEILAAPAEDAAQ